MSVFEGRAAIGAQRLPSGFRIVCCERFGVPYGGGPLEARLRAYDAVGAQAGGVLLEEAGPAGAADLDALDALFCDAYAVEVMAELARVHGGTGEDAPPAAVGRAGAVAAALAEAPGPEEAARRCYGDDPGCLSGR